MVRVALHDNDENYMKKEREIIDRYMKAHGDQYQLYPLTSAVDVLILGDDFHIIFVTACHGKFVDEFGTNIIRYLIKDDSVLETQMCTCLDEMMQTFHKDLSKLHFSFVEGDREIYPSNIIYIESFLHKVIFHFKDALETYSLYEKLDNVEEQLSVYGFCRIHKSFLVNMKYVESIRRYSAKLRNGIGTQKELKVSQGKYNQVKKEYMKYYEGTKVC